MLIMASFPKTFTSTVAAADLHSALTSLVTLACSGGTANSSELIILRFDEDLSLDSSDVLVADNIDGAL